MLLLTELAICSSFLMSLLQGHLKQVPSFELSSGPQWITTRGHCSSNGSHTSGGRGKVWLMTVIGGGTELRQSQRTYKLQEKCQTTP